MAYKLYKEMDNAEKLDWLNAFTTFSTTKMPLLLSLGLTWEDAHRKTFEEGLELINAFSFCRSWVKESLFFGNYNSRAKRLKYLMDKITADVSKDIFVQGANGESMVYSPILQPRKKTRGRPSMQELKAEREQEVALEAERERVRLIAELNGVDIVEMKPERQPNNEELCEAKKQMEKQSPLLFAETEVARQPLEMMTKKADVVLDAQRLHLDQISYLLSDELAVRVKSVATLRASATTSAERAKMLGEQGASQDEIAKYAREATDLIETVETIYSAVDRELARLYVLIPFDATWCGKREFVEQSGRNEAEFLKFLKPYHDKVVNEDKDFEKQTINAFEESRPEVMAERQRRAALEVKYAKYAKYIKRTDKQPTAQRIQTMKERIEELRNDGFDVVDLEVILNKTIVDNEAMEA